MLQNGTLMVTVLMLFAKAAIIATKDTASVKTR